MNSYFTVPAGVTQLEFEVAGGAGGGNGAWAGSGSLVRGTLVVTPGELLTLTVGQGGWQDDVELATITRPEVPGGGGYGDGGSVPEVNRLWSDNTTVVTTQGGSGGGGSAILSGTTPLVVAGGGGGRHHGVWEQTDWTRTTNATAGNGNQPNSAITNRLNRNGNSFYLEGGAANGASGGTPGTGGVAATNIGGATVTVGNSGNGRNGGAGRGTGVNNSQVLTGTTSTKLRTASGAGGGGYAGGGAGGTAGYTNNVTKAVLGGPGGGGSNFAATRAAVTATSLANNDTGPANTRRPGWITLRYQICT
ncbi:hypothetical protein ACF044_17155 [Microbacterium sp. NPDC016588]